MNERDKETLLRSLRDRAEEGATMVELVELVHEAEGVPHYERGLVLFWFHEAFGLTAADFTGIVLACEIFGGGASLSVAEAERRFRERLIELGGIAAGD